MLFNVNVNVYCFDLKLITQLYFKPCAQDFFMNINFCHVTDILGPFTAIR